MMCRHDGPEWWPIGLNCRANEQYTLYSEKTEKKLTIYTSVNYVIIASDIVLSPNEH